MNRQNLLYLLIGLILIVVAVLLSFQSSSYLDTGTSEEGLQTRSFAFSTDHGPVSIDVEVADTHETRVMGLMHRESLGTNKGMLFIFDTETPLSFWMKNTLIPLDMVFISEEKRIVSITEHAQPCERDPCPLYPSEQPALYVVEANGGFTERHGIKVGDRVQFDTE